MKPGDIELHIEELVLHGFSPADRLLIGQAVEHELARLFAERGAPPSLARRDQMADLDGGSFETRPGSAVETLGTQVALAVYGGLSV